MNLSRRSLFTAGAAFLAAPSIVRAASLMPVSVLPNHFGHLTFDAIARMTDEHMAEHIYFLNTKYYSLWLNQNPPVLFLGVDPGPSDA